TVGATADSQPNRCAPRLSATLETIPISRPQTVGATVEPTPMSRAPRVSDDFLLVAADSLDRAEGMRIALSNQVRALGENVGVGSPEQRYVAVMVVSMAKFE